MSKSHQICYLLVNSVTWPKIPPTHLSHSHSTQTAILLAKTLPENSTLDNLGFPLPLFHPLIQLYQISESFTMTFSFSPALILRGLVVLMESSYIVFCFLSVIIHVSFMLEMCCIHLHPEKVKDLNLSNWPFIALISYLLSLRHWIYPQ